jgi:K+-sensing histidine kinase KdpD
VYAPYKEISMDHPDQYRQRYEAFFRALQGAVNIADLEELLLVLVFQYQEIMDFDAMHLQLLDKKGSFVKTYALDQSGKLLWGVEVPLDRTNVQDILHRGKPVVHEDLGPDPRIPEGKYFSSMGVKSLMRFPMRVKGQGLGVVNFLFGAPRSFSQEELRFAETAANILAFYLPERLEVEPEAIQQEVMKTLVQSKKQAITVPTGFMEDIQATLKVLEETSERFDRADSQPLTPRQRDYMRYITDLQRILQNHMKTLIQYFDVELGRIEPRKKLIRFDRFLQETAGEIHQEAVAKKLRLYLDIKQNLPNVTTDGSIVKQILNILLQNAVRYSKAGGAITIGACMGEMGLRIDITDSAHSLSEADRRRFLAADRARTAHQIKVPHGLSLALARRLAALLKGDITASIQKGEGNIFSLHLPTDEMI